MMEFKTDRFAFIRARAGGFARYARKPLRRRKRNQRTFGQRGDAIRALCFSLVFGARAQYHRQRRLSAASEATASIAMMRVIKTRAFFMVLSQASVAAIFAAQNPARPAPTCAEPPRRQTETRRRHRYAEPSVPQKHRRCATA